MLDGITVMYMTYMCLTVAIPVQVIICFCPSETIQGHCTMHTLIPELIEFMHHKIISISLTKRHSYDSYYRKLHVCHRLETPMLAEVYLTICMSHNIR